MASAINEHVSHKWLCLLDTQYRMHSDIADFASVNMYNNLLHTYEGVNDQREDIKSSLPSKDTVISFADLSGMMSVCTKTADNSRINVLSAFITLSLALQGAKKHEVGIITPYRSQSRLIHAMIRDVLDNNSDLYPMSCATVHQFQGSEKDIIIYDAVDCYRMSYPGTLLVSKANNYADRLFNVALTRAKGKFVAVANMSYMEKKKLPKDLMFTKMMAQQKYSQSCHRGAELISDSASFGDIISFFDDDDGWYAFLSDLSHAKQEVTIDIPAAPVNSRNLVSLVDKVGVLKTHGVKVIIRAEKKETLPSCMKPISIENKGAMNPVAIIDKKLVWFGMPQSDADFVSENVVIKSKYHPIIRFPGKYTARTLYGFLGMSNTVDQDTNISRNNNGTANSNNFASYVFSSMRCPDCGKPMKLNKSKKTSKYFIGCSDYPSCKHTELVTAEFVEDYLYRNKKRGEPCPQCGCSLTAKRGKYGIYVECFGILKHKYGLDEI